jgi:hypothetical protein
MYGLHANDEIDPLHCHGLLLCLGWLIAITSLKDFVFCRDLYGVNKFMKIADVAALDAALQQPS